jgi:hypothetical protein
VPVYARVDCMRGARVRIERSSLVWSVDSEGFKGSQPWRGDGCMHPSI